MDVSVVDLVRAGELDFASLSPELRRSLSAQYEVVEVLGEGSHLSDCPSAGGRRGVLMSPVNLYMHLAWCCEESVAHHYEVDASAAVITQHRQRTLVPPREHEVTRWRMGLPSVEPALAEQLGNLLDDVEDSRQEWLARCGMRRLAQEARHCGRAGLCPDATWDAEPLELGASILVEVQPAHYVDVPRAVTLTDHGADAWEHFFGAGNHALVPAELVPLLRAAAARGHHVKWLEVGAARVGETALVLASGGLELEEAFLAAQAVES